jgi:pimeloyl-ACP methyl ester carboxylesterase
MLTVSAGAPAAARPYCLSTGDGFRQVSFKAADGVSLRGITTGKGKLGLVLGHQVSSSSCEWYDMAKVFATHGYRVLALDFRGFGMSPVPAPPKSTTALAADVGGAATELRRLGVKRVVAIGSSMGGTAVVIAGATRTYHLAGVVSLSGAGSFWNNNALAAAHRLTIPARFLAAEGDGSFPDDARAMARSARARDKGVLILPGGAHGTSLLDNTLTARRARVYVLAFLRRLA